LTIELALFENNSMEKQDRDKILEIANDIGIEVQFAKKKTDLQVEGVHLVEPTIEQVLNGVLSAIAHGCDVVMIHSRVTWPFKDY
jgi:hypothetical protein